MRTLYAGANGRAEFFMSGEFSVALDAGVYQADADELERAGRDCLALLGMEAELVSRETREQESVWTYRQLWEDVPVFSCQVELTWRDGSLVLLRGRRLAGSALPADTGAPLTTATVLVRFLAGLNEGNYVCSRIDGMRAGYVVSGASRSGQLTPVWRVETDTGAYEVAGVTGALVPVE